jgi:hypothetical protein
MIYFRSIYHNSKEDKVVPVLKKAPHQENIRASGGIFYAF